MDSTPKPERRRGCAGNCLLYTIAIAVLAVGLSAACAFFIPQTFQSVIKIAQGAGLSTYIWVLGATGNPALKVTTFEADVTATASVNRDMGPLSLIYGEGAQVTGTVRVALGADLKNNNFGVLSCDIDTNTIQTSEGHAPLAGTAFSSDDIKQAAYQAFEKEAASQAIEKFWPSARQRLKDQFTSWALGLVVPEQPNAIECPTITPLTTPQPSATP